MQLSNELEITTKPSNLIDLIAPKRTIIDLNMVKKRSKNKQINHDINSLKD
jgi:hypothetical protein